jgi:glyoxylase I family protein
MFTVLDIDHLVLRSANARALVEFYCGALGCTVERDRPDIGLIQLRAGNSMIDIVPVDGTLGRRGGRAPGIEGRNLDHLCLRIAPFDHTDIAAHLGQFNVECPPPEQRYGADGMGPSIYIADPDGNTVELKGPPDPA